LEDSRPDSSYSYIVDRRWHSSIFDVRSFRGLDCNADHYLVVAKFMESLAISKETAQNFDVKRFNLRVLNELEVRKQFKLGSQTGLQLWRT